MSNIVLALHTLIFGAFSASSLGSLAVAYFYPEALTSVPVLVGAGLLAVLVVIMWTVLGGCPLTIWENKMRIKEGKEPYAGPCIDRYAARWFGVALPKDASTYFLYVLLALPVISAGASWFFPA